MNIVNKEDVIANPEECRSHVILLGAGASFAAFPNGDANQKKLPLMKDLVEVISLNELLENNGIDSTGNFEVIYGSLKNDAIKKEIDDRIFKYFCAMELPETVTLYDKLLLSLRSKDAIFTFNWDPFLFDAYQRNKDVAPLPKIFFLHGNVRIGACELCDNFGRFPGLCSSCDKPFNEVPLFYPVKEKRYFDSNRYTASSWESAKQLFAQAFTVTIFGYSAPLSDKAAIALLKKAWLRESSRQFEHIEVIDRLSGSELVKKWKPFIPTLHLASWQKFEDSWLWMWPRRSSEALFRSKSRVPCEKFSIPNTDNLEELQDAIKKISTHENNLNRRTS